jgi:hypothetical protein
MMTARTLLATWLAVVTMVCAAATAHAVDEVIPPPEDVPPLNSLPPADAGAPPADVGASPLDAGASADAGQAGLTPPRLSLVQGDVSFWRPGAEDWAPAQANTPLAPGDALYAANGANLELQIGARAFLRAGAGTQLSFENHDPRFLQFKVTAGHVSLDLRSLPAGHTIEIDTPNTAFTVDHTGYYRVDVDGETTTFVTRRGGYAAMIPANGQASGVSPSEEVVVSGAEAPAVASYSAPEPGNWDHWNYDRTDYLIDSLSARYVPPGVYGADALDHYGNWRVVSNYGPVWVPSGVDPAWAPYSTGRWLWDPYYAWTWVDTAPWGWAPYHYGRWVYVGNYWAWAPGPLVATPVYAPALVAFFGGGGVSVGIGAPLGWVALSWGEPCVPWWGGAHFAGRPWWGGWGGPRVVNNVVINNTTIVNVNNINTYRNVGVHHALITVPEDRFGRGRVDRGRFGNIDPHQLRPIHGDLPVKPSPASLVPAAGRGVRPPERVIQRRVVGTRPPHDPAPDLRSAGLKPGPTRGAPESRLVTPPRHTQEVLSSPRPPFGPSKAPERVRPSLPPRFHETAPQRSAPPRLTNVGPGSEGAAPPRREPPPPDRPRPERGHLQGPISGAPVEAPRMAPPQMQPPPAMPAPGPPAHSVIPRGGPPRGEPPRGEPPYSAPPPRAERPQPAPRPLPGEPANRVYPGHGAGQQQPFQGPQHHTPHGFYAPAPRGGAPAHR